MRNPFGQTASVISISLRGSFGRTGLTLSVMLCVALVVATLLSLDALRRGLTFALEQSGSSDIALIMRGGSQSEMNSALSGEQVDILLAAPGVDAISPEVNLIVDGIQRSDGARANIGLRGLTGVGVSMRPRVSLIDGRWPAVGASELAVGADVARRYVGFELGDTVRFGAAGWTIVGVFEAAGGVVASEIWADLTAVQNLFDRANTVQSVRAGLQKSGDILELAAFVERDPRLQLAVQTEASYYAAQAARNSELVQNLAWPLAILLAVGAVVGALNIMLASLAERRVEIATFRAVGFSRRAICSGLVIEYLIICVVAGLLGALAAYLILDGAEATALSSGVTRIGYVLQFSPTGLLQGVILSAAIGICGSLVPAVLAGRRRVTLDLTR
ncbi:MAG: ABC transporter permease [Pseudomonadota bacterium]